MKKRKYFIGALVMLILIIIALPLGVNRSFSRLAEEVSNHYYYDDTGFVIWEAIDNREAAASNLITVAEKYVDKDAELITCINDLEYAVKKSQNAYDYETFYDEVEANAEMTAASEALYERLSTVELSEKDAKYPDQLIAQMRSEQDKIQRSSYNDEARAYNAKLSAFPINFIRMFAGVSPMATFDADMSPVIEEVVSDMP